MHPDWARSLRDQCAAANVPFFFKQWGEWGDYVDSINVCRQHALCGLMAREPALEKNWAKALEFMRSTNGVDGAGVVARIGKKAAGRTLDGKEHNEFPQAKETAFE
jgi:protein gp37